MEELWKKASQIRDLVTGLIPPRSDPNKVLSQLLIYNIACLSLCIVAYCKYEVL
jgi:hypothetical protein